MSNAKRNRESRKWKRYYWMMVISIFIALIVMVRFVLDTSKIYVDENMPINPYYIDWNIEPNGTLRLNDPYYLKTDCKLINTNLERLKSDTSIYNSLVVRSKSGSTLKDVKPPYLLWKNAHSDTIHVLKNNTLLKFKYVSAE